MSRYGDVHRLFLQSMMSHRVIKESVAITKLQKAYEALEQECEGFLCENDLSKIIKQINVKINCLNMEIRSEICETSSDKYILLVNTATSPINLTLCKYSESELQFFKKIVDEIVGSDIGRVSSIACLNLVDSQKSKTEQEALIKRFIEDMWLIDEEGKLGLSIRSISELAPYLRSTYKDYLINCTLCKELVLHGFHCQYCPAIFHRHCLSKYAKRSTNLQSVKCPGSNCAGILADLSLFLNVDEDPIAEKSESPPEEIPAKRSRDRR